VKKSSESPGLTLKRMNEREMVRHSVVVYTSVCGFEGAAQGVGVTWWEREIRICKRGGVRGGEKMKTCSKQCGDTLAVKKMTWKADVCGLARDAFKRHTFSEARSI